MSTTDSSNIAPRVLLEKLGLMGYSGFTNGMYKECTLNASPEIVFSQQVNWRSMSSMRHAMIACIDRSNLSVQNSVRGILYFWTCVPAEPLRVPWTGNHHWGSARLEITSSIGRGRSQRTAAQFLDRQISIRVRGAPFFDAEKHLRRTM